MKRILFVLGLVFLIGVVSAHGYWLEDYEGFADNDYKEKIVVTTYYDNNDRFSTYDYRHGYTYRATGDYYDRKIVSRDYRYRDYDRYGYKDYDYGDYRVKGVRYEYVPYLKTVEGRECFVTPPGDRLFYVRC